jgi:hypothetical protein
VSAVASATIRLDGVTYSSPDEAYVGADTLEHAAQERADVYRENGDEGMADTTIDRGRAKAERLRAWARQREADEAAATAQPAGRPTPRASSKRSTGGSAPAKPPPAGRTSKRPAGGAFGGSGGKLARTGYRRSGAQAAVGSATGFGWQLAGLTVGMALLVLFLRPRGVTAFSELANIAAGALSIVVDPVDPLEPKLLDKVAAQAAPASAKTATRRPANRRPARRGALV